MRHFLPITAVQYLIYRVRHRDLRRAWLLACALGMHCRPTLASDFKYGPRPAGTAWSYPGVAPVRLYFTWTEYRILRSTCGQWMPLLHHAGPNVDERTRGLWDLDHAIIQERRAPRELNWGPLSAMWMHGRCWFRVFGYGLRFADRSKHRAPFSERNKLVRHWRIGKWSIKPLLPNPIQRGRAQ